jgi:hypothetical protein
MADRTPRAVAERFGENLRPAPAPPRPLPGTVGGAASLHRTEIGLLEHGERTCRIDTLIQLAGTMGVPPGELLEGIDWIPGPEPRGTFSFASTRSHPRPPRGEPRR